MSKKTLPEGLEVLGYPGVEGFLALVYLRDCALAVAQCLLTRRKGQPKALYSASCSWSVLYAAPLQSMSPPEPCFREQQVCPCPECLVCTNSDLAPFLPLSPTAGQQPPHPLLQLSGKREDKLLDLLFSKPKMCIWGINSLSLPLLIIP